MTTFSIIHRLGDITSTRLSIRLRHREDHITVHQFEYSGGYSSCHYSIMTSDMRLWLYEALLVFSGNYRYSIHLSLALFPRHSHVFAENCEFFIYACH